MKNNYLRVSTGDLEKQITNTSKKDTHLSHKDLKESKTRSKESIDVPKLLNGFQEKLKISSTIAKRRLQKINQEKDNKREDPPNLQNCT